MSTHRHRIKIAKGVTATPPTEPKRHASLVKLADYFAHPETAPWDWEVLRDAKPRACNSEAANRKARHH